MYVPMDAREQAENLKVFSAILGLRLAGLGKIPAIKLKLLDGHDPVSCDAPMLCPSSWAPIWIAIALNVSSFTEAA